MKVTLLNDFPRQMGHPLRDLIAFTPQQRDQYIRKYIKKCNLYMTVYAFLEIDENGELVKRSAKLDKAFFDCDSENWLEDVLKLHWWCMKHNIIHRVHCSGRGGHVFIFLLPNVHTNKQTTLGNFQRYLAKKLDLDIDRKIIGDTARIFRYPNTYNWKVKRWCIPLTEEILSMPNLTTEYIYSLAKKKQHYPNPWLCKEGGLYDISRFNVEEYLYLSEDELKQIHDLTIDENIELKFPKFPPCVQSWLSTPDLSGEGKFNLVMFLKDQQYQLPFMLEEIVGILKQALSDDEFNHYFYNRRLRGHRGHGGAKFIHVLTTDYVMTNCEKLKRIGLCQFGNICNRVNPIYSKTY